MISASRSGGSLRPARRLAISFFQFGFSCIFPSRNAIDSFYEFVPSAPLGGEHAPAFFGQVVIAAAALAGLFNPTPVDPAALLDPIEHWIERGDAEFHGTGGALLDQLADVVTVAGLVLEQGEDHQLGAPLLQLHIL